MRRKWVGGLLAVVVVVAIVGGLWLQHEIALSRLQAAIDACQPWSLDAIMELAGRGYDLRTRGSDGATVAMVAAYWNDAKLLRLALEAGVDPNAADSFGNTALIYAMSSSGPEPGRLLVQAGAKVNQQARSGETALHQAVRNAQYDLVCLLVEAGAKVDVKNTKGETPLHLARTLGPGGPRPIRPDLTASDFVQVLENGRKDKPMR